MKPFPFLVIMFTLFSPVVFAQAPCDDIRKENEALRKALKLSEPILLETIDKTEIKLIKVEGNIKAQTIRLEILLTNHAANQVVRLNEPAGIDLDGNVYGGYYEHFFIGNELGRSILNTDVPIKGYVILKKILPSVAILKLFKFDYSSDTHYDRSTIEFRDLKVNWK